MPTALIGAAISVAGSAAQGQKGKKAAKKAAKQKNRFQQLAIGQLRPFADAGAGEIDALTKGASAGGLDERLAEIFDSDIFGSLVQDRERSARGQLAAGGLTRSGTALDAITKIGPGLGLELEQLLTGRSQQLAGQGLNATNSIAGFLTGQGSAKASGTLAAGQAGSGAIGNIAGILSSPSFLSAAGSFFSDRRLKVNAERVSEIMGLPVYQWDWIPQAKGTIIENSPTMGFMADEVQDRFPDMVAEYCGWKFVDYDGVLDKLMDSALAQSAEIDATDIRVSTWSH